MRRKKTSGLILVGIAIAALVVVPKSSATVIPTSGSGVVNLSNLSGTMVAISNACINWDSAAPCVGGTAVEDSVSSSDPTVFTSGSTALDTIKDLTAGGSFPVVDFETVQSPLPGGDVNFDLTGFFVPGAFGNCTSATVGTACNPGGGSPFDFFQSSQNSVVLSFTVDEIAYTGTSASGSTPYTSTFTTQLSGVLPNGMAATIPDILTYIAGGGIVSSTWSSTESPVTAPTATPEPNQLPLLSMVTVLGILSIRRFSGQRDKREALQ